MTTPNNPHPQQQQQPTFAEVLSKAVQARGLSLDRIRARLEAAGVPVSNATLSYWQSGRSLPTRARSLRTLVELESILQVEPGSLIELVRTADGKPRHQLFDWQTLLPAREAAEAVIAEMGLENNGRLSRVSVHDHAVLDDQGREISVVTRQVLRAERTGAQSFPVVNRQEGEASAAPQVTPIMGCRVGRTKAIPDKQLLVAEMVLPRPLQRGELFLTEYKMDLTPAMSTIITRSVGEQLRELVLSVEFHPDCIPEAARTVVLTSPDAQDEPVETSPLQIHGNQLQHCLLDLTPNVYALEWDWD